jgi:hypothetical protein
MRMRAREISTNPRVSTVLLFLSAFEVLVLLAAGGGLFFLPGFIKEVWPWTLTPFNTALLGGIYLSSMISGIHRTLVACAGGAGHDPGLHRCPDCDYHRISGSLSSLLQRQTFLAIQARQINRICRLELKM